MAKVSYFKFYFCYSIIDRLIEIKEHFILNRVIGKY